MAIKATKDALAKCDFLCIGSLEHPWGSWFWEFSEAPELTHHPYCFSSEYNHCCFGGKRVMWQRLLHNSKRLHEALHKPNCLYHQGLEPYGAVEAEDENFISAIAEKQEYPRSFCEAYAGGLRLEFSDRLND